MRNKHKVKVCLSLFLQSIDMRTAVNWSISCRQEYYQEKIEGGGFAKVLCSSHKTSTLKRNSKSVRADASYSNNSSNSSNFSTKTYEIIANRTLLDTSLMEKVKKVQFLNPSGSEKREKMVRLMLQIGLYYKKLF